MRLSSFASEVAANPLICWTYSHIVREQKHTIRARMMALWSEFMLAGQLNLPLHERIEDDAFRYAVSLLDAGNCLDLKAFLEQHTTLVQQHVAFKGGSYFKNPTLLEFVAENPVRHGSLPENIVEVARVILGAGPDSSARNETLMLVATGRVPRECRVQLPLIEVLCASGADPASAIIAAALHGEHEAVKALLKQGARLDLPVASALGQAAECSNLLPTASDQDRHIALALASQFGHVEIVRLLLDEGEDPSRYNPPGAHAHSTPLHQAALGGHDPVVRLLVQRGARLDIMDVLWQGTPADWASYGGHEGIERYLRSHEKLKVREP